mgnify:CR=1 FL=1
MKYITTITINKPKDTVWSAFTDYSNFKNWQPSLVSSESISGKQGDVNSKSKLIVKMGNKEKEMAETVLERKDGESMLVKYEMPGVVNNMKSTFKSLDALSTEWTTDNEFIFTTLFMKVIGALFGGSFKSQTKKDMEAFKTYVESL